MKVHYMTWQARSNDPGAAFDLTKPGADGHSVFSGIADEKLAPGESGGWNTTAPTVMR